MDPADWGACSSEGESWHRVLQQGPSWEDAVLPAEAASLQGRQREAGKMLPELRENGFWAALQSPGCCPAASPSLGRLPGEQRVPGDGWCPLLPEPLGRLGRLSAAQQAGRQEEHPAPGRASETAHSSCLPVRQRVPGAGW